MTTLDEYREMQHFLNTYDLLKETVNDITNIIELHSEITECQARATIQQIKQILERCKTRNDNEILSNNRCQRGL